MYVVIYLSLCCDRKGKEKKNPVSAFLPSSVPLTLVENRVKSRGISAPALSASDSLG